MRIKSLIALVIISSSFAYGLTAPDIFEGLAVLDSPAQLNSTICPNLNNVQSVCTEDSLSKFVHRMAIQKIFYEDPGKIVEIGNNVQDFMKTPRESCKYGNYTCSGNGYNMCVETFSKLEAIVDYIMTAIGSVPVMAAGYMNELARVTLASACSFCEDQSYYNQLNGNPIAIPQETYQKLENAFAQAADEIGDVVDSLSSLFFNNDDCAVMQLSSKFPYLTGLFQWLSNIAYLGTCDNMCIMYTLQDFQYNIFELNSYITNTFNVLMLQSNTSQHMVSNTLFGASDNANEAPKDFGSIYASLNNTQYCLNTKKLIMAGFDAHGFNYGETESFVHPPSKSLTKGQVITIVICSIICSIIFIVLVTVLVWYFIRRKHKKSKQQLQA